MKNSYTLFSLPFFGIELIFYPSDSGPPYWVNE